MNDKIPHESAEQRARRTAAAAALADYRRLVAADALRTGPQFEHWSGRLAAALESVLELQDGAAAAQLAEIRALLAAFDWEWHDRQLALEAIERIAGGEQ